MQCYTNMYQIMLYKFDIILILIGIISGEINNVNKMDSSQNMLLCVLLLISEKYWII